MQQREPAIRNARLRGFVYIVVGAVIGAGYLGYIFSQAQQGVPRFTVFNFFLVVPLSFISIGLVWLVGGDAAGKLIPRDVNNLTAGNVVLLLVMVAIGAVLYIVFLGSLHALGYS